MLPEPRSNPSRFWLPRSPPGWLLSHIDVSQPPFDGAGEVRASKIHPNKKRLQMHFIGRSAR